MRQIPHKARQILCCGMLVLLTIQVFQYIPFSGLGVKPVNAMATTTLGLWSPVYESRSVVNSSIPVNNMIKFRVNVSDIPASTPINAFDIRVNWDSAILNGVNVTYRGGIFDKPGFFESPGGSEVATDHVRFGGLLLGGTVTENGAVIIFTVRVMATGSTTVSIDTTISKLLQASTQVPYFPMHGYFSNEAGRGDLMLTSLAFPSDTIPIGDSVDLRLGVRNIGSVQMNDVQVTVVGNNSLAIGSSSLGSMAANTRQSTVISWNTTGLPPGVYQVNATVTTSSLDAFPNDNSITTVSVKLVIHDLAALRLEWRVSAIINETVKLNTTIANLGTIQDLANVSIYANSTLVRIETLLTTSKTITVQPGTNQTVRFDWDTETLIDLLITGTRSDLGRLLKSDSRLRFFDSIANGTRLGNDTRIQFVDSNSNNSWEIGEPVVYDTNYNNFTDAGEPIIAGSPLVGQRLNNDTSARFNLRFNDVNRNTSWDPSEDVVYDANSNILYDAGEPMVAGGNHAWDEGETVILDSNSNGTYDLGEAVLVGTTPTPGTGLRIDANILFVDTNNDNSWTTGESAALDRNVNSIYDFGTGTYFFRVVVKTVQGERNISNNNLNQGSIIICQRFPCLNHDLQVTASNLPVGTSFIGINQNGTVTVRNNANLTDSYTLRIFLTSLSANSTVFEVGGSIAAFPDNVTIPFSFPTSGLQAANYNVTARVFCICVDDDPANNQADSSMSLSLKRTPRTVFTVNSNTASAVVVRIATSVTFNATGTGDLDEASGFRVTRFTWDFGDGTSMACNVTATEKCLVTTHAYSVAANYTVTLTVKSNCEFAGCQGSLAKTVKVNNPPTARFTHSPASPDPGVEVAFDASSSTDTDGSITSYLWDFGDGTTATGKTVKHSFGSGTYSVKLTVTDSDGDENEFTVTINVPLISFTTALLIGGGLGGAAAVGGGWFFLARRRKAASSSPGRNP